MTPKSTGVLVAHPTTRQDQHHLSFVVAQKVLPAFRDKFDYSNPKDFASLAVFAFEAADALVARHLVLLEAAKAADRAEYEDNKRAAEVAFIAAADAREAARTATEAKP